MKKKFVYTSIIIIIIAALVGTYLYFGVDKEYKSQYQTQKVVRGDLVQTVTATGAVKGAAEIDLGFSLSGTVDIVLAKVGARVSSGQELVSLESRDLEIEVSRAQAALELAQANLDLKLAGVSQSAKAVAQAEVDKAKAALESAQAEYTTVVESSAAEIESAKIALEVAEDDLENAEIELENIKETDQQDIDNAYQSAIIEMQGNMAQVQKALSDMDEILGVDDSDVNDAFETLLKAKSGQTFIDAQLAYEEASSGYAKVLPQVSSLGDSSSYATIDSAIVESQELLNNTYDALSLTRDVLDAAVVGDGLSLAELSAFETTTDSNRTLINTEMSTLEASRQAIKSSLLAAKTNEDTAQSNKEEAENALLIAKQALVQAQASADQAASAAQSKIDNAKELLQLAKANLADLTAAPRDVDVAALRAQVKRSEAALELAKKNLLDAVLVAPVSGVITGVFVEKGEQVSLQSVAVTMLADGEFRVEVDISESDIAKVSLGDDAEITFDAYGDDVVFHSEVISIDPGPTIIQDVIYYQVDLDISAIGYEVKQDMSANVTIYTQKKENVLIAPSRAVMTTDGKKKVRVLNGEEVVIKEVTTGLRGDDGLLEIVSGLREGEEVIIFDRSQKTSKF